ncbi:cyclin-C [Trichinella spiralis]|uniref:cyclin-C n=1 Tax=Trichinella spiralis TaxID=6334 RepID=UPI0001EFE614|nr:cyclin-C [Trichinella spiralis]
MDYVIKFLFSRSRWRSQIAFPTVLMFFLVTQVRNGEDESRILNDLHRITYLCLLFIMPFVIWL